MSSNYPSKIPLLITKNQVLMPNGIIHTTISNISEIKMLSYILEHDNIVGVALKQGDDCFNMGCAGYVETVQHANDEYTLTINGFKRFLIRRKKLSLFLYWNAFISWDAEVEEIENFTHQQRKQLVQTIRTYLEKTNTQNLQKDDLFKQPIDILINGIGDISGLKPLEKQALLESQNLQSRYELVMSLMDMKIKETYHCSQSALS